MKRRSFTTMEVIMAISIFALLAIFVLGWQKDIFFINNLLNKRLTSQENIRRTLKNFIAEIRTAQRSAAGDHHLEIVNKDAVTFYSDIDLDGVVEKIRYFLQDKKIKRGVIEPSGQPPVYNPDDEIVTEIIADVINANDEVFTYFDKDYDGDDPPLPQPVNVLDVRLVKITITVDEDASRPPGPIIETTQTSIRNLKDNL